jgi:hypothetical protein
MGPTLAGSAVIWIGLAVDSIVESIRATSFSVRLVGASLFQTTATGEAVGLVLISLSVGVVATLLIRGLMGSRLTAVVRREVDRRWNEMSVKSAGAEARNELLMWRIEELQRQLRELMGKRDDMVEEMSRLEARSKHLRGEAEPGPRPDDVVRVPDLAERDPR